MLIDLTKSENWESSFDISLSPDEIDLLSDSAKLKNHINARGKWEKKIAQTDVEGEIFARVEGECSRCLEAVEINLTIPFKAVFVAPENYTEAREAELHADDLEVSIFDDDKIDLREIVREQILLNLPAQVFCTEDCEGLCQKCGANLNLIDCNCEEYEIDPRWSALKNLKL